MKALFITGVGTGVGKTFVAAALLHQLTAAGRKGAALKPVATGFVESDPESDAAILLRAANLEATEQAIARVSPWRYPDPLSPDQAAAKAGRPIAPEAVVDFCRKAIREKGTTLIEGIGGAFTPLAEGFLVADLIKALKVPALLVTASYLGTLSHTLAAVEALAARKIKPRAIIASQSLNGPVPLRETVRSLEANVKAIPIFPLPFQSGADAFARAPDLLHLLK